MATADEILATMAEEAAETGHAAEVCTIDRCTRAVTIPEALRIVGVETDKDVTRRVFRVLCSYRGTNLSTFRIRIHFMNANKEKDIYYVTDAAQDGEYLTFSWVISRKATKYKGKLQFIACMVCDGGTDEEREWNSTLGEFTVLEGLEVELTDGEEEQARDAITQLLAVIDARESEAVEAVRAAGVETIATIPEDYTALCKNVDALSEDIVAFSTIKAGSLVQWRKGGVMSNGQIYVDQTKNRIVSTLVSLRKGDVISCADGYALAVNFYSHYSSGDDFELITRQAMTENSITVPVDCVAFIGAKKTDDAAFTADEILMANHFVHIPDQHKGVSELLAKGAEENAFRNIAGIPVNALAFYDKWAQEIPESKYAYTRELLTYADDTESYPVYLYRFALYNNWVDNNYAYNNYTPEKDNALYRKPRILVTSGIHGNERATPVAVMAFAKNLLENPAYAHLLGQYDWYFVPLVNPWGFT